MQPLQSKRIVVGITGGIAAYKSIELIRLLRKNQADVRVVLLRLLQIRYSFNVTSHLRQCRGSVSLGSPS